MRKSTAFLLLVALLLPLAGCMTPAKTSLEEPAYSASVLLSPSFENDPTVPSELSAAGESPTPSQESAEPIPTPSPSPAPIPTEKGDDLPFLPYYYQKAGYMPIEKITTVQEYLWLVGEDPEHFSCFSVMIDGTDKVKEGDTYTIIYGWRVWGDKPLFSIRLYERNPVFSNYEDAMKYTVYACISETNNDRAPEWSVFETRIAALDYDCIGVDLWTEEIADYLSYEEGGRTDYYVYLLFYNGEEQIACTEFMLIYEKKDEDYLRSVTESDS